MNHSPETANILIVDDAVANIKVLAETLKADYEICFATNGPQALDIVLSEHPPDLILLDVMMPEMDGYEVCRILKADDATQNIPIIFITARSETEDETRGLALGAADYITKPFCPAIVRARVHTQLERCQAEKERLQREKLQSVMETAGAVCHELNQPMQVISGYLDLIMMDLPDDHALYEDLDKMKKQILRMGEITRKLMRITRYQVKNYLGDRSTIIDIDKSAG